MPPGWGWGCSQGVPGAQRVPAGRGPSLPWCFLDGATFVLAAGSPPPRWEEGAGLRRKRAVLAVLLHFLETYKGLLQEEESAGKVIKVGAHPAAPPAPSPPAAPLPEPHSPPTRSSTCSS